MLALLLVSCPYSTGEMAAYSGAGGRSHPNITDDDAICEPPLDGNVSEIDDLDGDDLEANSSFSEIADEDRDLSTDAEDYDIQIVIEEPPSTPVPEVHIPLPSPARPTDRPSRSSRGDRSTSAESTSNERNASTSHTSRKRVWKEVEYHDKQHNFSALPTRPVRRPIDYIRDYFDDTFFQKVSHCTNQYYLRTTGIDLKCTSTEIAKLFSIHIIMGCIPFPRLPMYWRTGTRLDLICNIMTRDRFLALRNALHVVENDSPTESEKDNPLWKVQPMIDQVKNTCNKLERQPGFYSIDKQMISFTCRRKHSKIVKNKPRLEGLKTFVLTTDKGLMIDFAIYTGAKTEFGETHLGLGPSMVLHLAKSVPPGSCVYHDSYFTTLELIEEMEKLNLHATGTLRQDRIPDRATIEFRKSAKMYRGESQQFVCDSTAIVKWKYNNSILLASNCTGASETAYRKRWDKIKKRYVEVSAPKIVSNYNEHKGGVNFLDQHMDHCRTFIKTNKWTLKVLIHFMDLALVNSWKLYHNDYFSNQLPRKSRMALVDFRMAVADMLSCTPERSRRQEDDDDHLSDTQNFNIYRTAIAPSEGKRYDGYEHYPVFDSIKYPRACRMENCSSRTKMKCDKCNIYLCLTRDKNCFKNFHKSSSC